MCPLIASTTYRCNEFVTPANRAATWRPQSTNMLGLQGKVEMFSLRLSALVIVCVALGLANAPVLSIKQVDAKPASCFVKVHLSVPYDAQHPYRIAQADIGPGCEVTESLRDLSPSEFASVAGTSGVGPEQALTSYTNRVKTRVRAEHAQIMMAQVDSFETWSWNGTSVTNYTNGWVQPATGGCGWHVTDGPYAWWETGNMPYAIWIYGWTNFASSCNPVDRGWMQAAAWGDYDGNWSGECDSEMYLPFGSALQCIPTLIY